jgi:hypothetical protein
MCQRENIATAARQGALFASKCPFLKEGTVPFEIIDISLQQI